MVFHKRILSITAVVALGALTAFAAQTPASKPAVTASKASVPKAHVAEGSVVTATNDMLTVRSGKKDMNFKINSATQKPSSLITGSNVKVSYHDEGSQHVATSVEIMAPKSSTAAKTPAKK